MNFRGIKRGIMELADAIVINKADGDNKNPALVAQRQYLNALHLFPPAESDWVTPVVLCSSILNKGISEVWDIITKYLEFTGENGYFRKNRNLQEKRIMYDEIQHALQDNFYRDEMIREFLLEKESQVNEGKISSYAAAQQVMEAFLRR